jgi:DNA helicase-2/ATP-dependent DNA helicase PcrA
VELLEEVRMQGVVSPPSSLFDDFQTDTASSEKLKLGQRVFHQKFGEGIVLNYEGQGRHARVQVNFESAGSKWLVMEYANLVVSA